MPDKTSRQLQSTTRRKFKLPHTHKQASTHARTRARTHAQHAHTHADSQTHIAQVVEYHAQTRIDMQTDVGTHGHPNPHTHTRHTQHLHTHSVTHIASPHDARYAGSRDRGSISLKLSPLKNCTPVVSSNPYSCRLHIRARPSGTA